MEVVHQNKKGLTEIEIQQQKMKSFSFMAGSKHIVLKKKLARVGEFFYATLPINQPILYKLIYDNI